MLIIGATGQTGLEVVRLAITRGPVSVLIRNPADRSKFPESVDAIVGDVLDPDRVRSAVQGHDEIICALGVRQGTPPGTVRSQGTANLIDAMTSVGAQRVVAVSSVGVGSSRADQTWPARLLWPRLVGADRLAEAARAEEVIAKSTLDWTIVRPPRLLDGPAATRVTVSEHVRLPLSAQLRRIDLAAALVNCLADPTTITKILTAVSLPAPREHRTV